MKLLNAEKIKLMTYYRINKIKQNLFEFFYVVINK